MKTKRTDVVVSAVVALSLMANAVMAEPADSCTPQKKAKGPMKVFILAGQSNMEGPADIRTIGYIGDDPATAPMYKEMVGADGKPVVCDHAWLSYLTGSKVTNIEVTGKMTAGYGTLKGSPQLGSCIGPEFTFGIYMSKAVKEPFLIIKTAWGGKSLHTDFRPPSAGPFVFPGPGKNAKAENTGVYYRYMIEHVKSVLKDIKRVCPEYEGQGYEIAGFVWLQGWNDLVAHDVYPKNDYSKYSEWLADFIRDVRKDLNTPNMPFVIGVIGVEGDIKNISPRYVGSHTTFRAAMAAPAAMPEFKGRVVAVHTAPFWDEKLSAIGKKLGLLKGQSNLLDKQVKEGKLTKEEAKKQLKEFEDTLVTAEERALLKRGSSNAGFHYLGCAKTFALMGKSFAEALTGMEKK